MQLRSNTLRGSQVWAAWVLVWCLGGTPSSAATAGCDVTQVTAAIFDSTVGSCDLNGDGVVSAADLTEAIILLPPPATPTNSSSPTVTATPTITGTPTKAACPSGAELMIEIDNRTGSSPISVVVTGERLSEECGAGTLDTLYSQTLDCAGVGVVSCAQFSALAPGLWRHSISVIAPSNGQLQHQASLLTGGSTPNRLRFTAFASVFSVSNTANAGNGSLRKMLQDVGTAAPPALIEFDPTVFPAGVPTTIALDFALPTLAVNDVTIDGTDAAGGAGNRIVDAGGLPIGVLAITGARNHITGMRLRNAGGNERDVLSIAGPGADGNVVEHTTIEQAASADGIGVDQQAGKDFGDTATVIRDCEVFGAADKGIKITTGAFARIERSWVHDNANGGIQATLGGHVQAWHNLVERNRGSTAQNGLSVNADDGDAMPTGFSELVTWGNISRGNGANGISVRAFSMANLHDDYLATNLSSGLRVFNDVGPPASAVVTGTSAVCNAVDGAVVANTSTADFGGGPLGSLGNNAFTQNNLPAGGANLRNASGLPVNAINNQWEHCGRETECDAALIAADDLSDHGAQTTFVPAQAQRALQPVLTSTASTKGVQGELLRIFGSGFNVIDGHFSEKDNQCADVVGRNRCVPLRGNCVQINGVPAAVEAVTPTMLVVRWPFTCVAPVDLVVRIDQGATVATSNTLTVCTNGE